MSDVDTYVMGLEHRVAAALRLLDAQPQIADAFTVELRATLAGERGDDLWVTLTEHLAVREELNRAIKHADLLTNRIGVLQGRINSATLIPCQNREVHGTHEYTRQASARCPGIYPPRAETVLR